MGTPLFVTGNLPSSQECRIRLRLGQVPNLTSPRYSGIRLAFDFDESHTWESTAGGRPAEVGCQRTIGEGLLWLIGATGSALLLSLSDIDTLTGCVRYL